MEDNEIERLLDSFRYLKLLGELNLANNNLTDLPYTFKNINVNENISLERNLFITIPPCLTEINRKPPEIMINHSIFIGNKNGFDLDSYNDNDYWFSMIVSPIRTWGTEKRLDKKNKSDYGI